MAKTVFSSDLQKFCRTFAAPARGAMLLDGSPLSKTAPGFIDGLKMQERALFERLLLFDKVQLPVVGANVIAPLLCNRMGIRTFEELLEQDALSFVVWEPIPMISHNGERVEAAFTAGDTRSPFDIEEKIDKGLAVETVGGLNTAGRRNLKKKLFQQYTVIDQKITEEAWPIVHRAMLGGELEPFGLSKRESIIDSPIADGAVLVDAAEINT